MADVLGRARDPGRGRVRRHPRRAPVARMAHVARPARCIPARAVGRPRGARRVDAARVRRLALLEERHERRVLDAGRHSGVRAPGRRQDLTPRRVATYSLAVTAAAPPAYNLRFRVGPLPTTLLEVLVLVTVATYAWMLWSERRRPAARTPYDIPIALLLVAGIIGIV